MTGMRRGNISIESELVSGFQKPCLCTYCDGDIVDVVALFGNEECAEHFWDVFDYVINGNESPYIRKLMSL